MRQITRNYNDKPRKLTLNTTRQAWTNIAIAGNANAVVRAIYSDPYYDGDGKTASRVIDKLNTWYLHKCAYCERIYKMDVEHYRPSAEVRDDNNNLVTYLDQNNQPIQHPGYYWLCYEWSNLVPACISCNREGGKGSKFPTITMYNRNAPVVGGVLDITRCFVGHVDLTAENPYLLHPENDNITGIFGFEVAEKMKGIKIVGLDNLNRGEITIDLCQMNRPEIRVSRLKEVIEPIKDCMIISMKFLSVGRKTLEETRRDVELYLQKLYNDAENVTLSHTCLRSYIVQNAQNFEKIVIPFIPRPMQEILLSAFLNYQPL